MSYSPGQHVNNIPGGIAIAKGAIDDLSGIQKFGYSASVGTSFTTIWEGVTPYPYITTAAPVTLVSTDPTADNGTTVDVLGLDADYNPITERITVGGAAGVKNFIRIYRMATVTTHTGNVNQGTITALVGGVVRAYCLALEGQTLMAVYTVPAGYSAYLISLYASPSKQKEMTVRLITRPYGNGGAFNVKAYGTSFGNSFVRNYTVVERLSARTDIELQAKVDATSAVSGGFELILERDH